MARTNRILTERPLPNPCEEAYSLSVTVFESDEIEQYPHPFPLLDYEPWGDAPRTIVELRMCALSATIRDKPQWYEKMKDPAIKQKWREEALEQGSAGLDGKPEWRLTEKMVDYVLAELEGYAKLHDEETGIQAGCYERVWKSDSLVSNSLRDALLHSVVKLEDVPAKKRDWHPGSNGRVLDLVHPSLYPLRYKSTHVHRPSEAVSDVATTPPRTDMRSDHAFLSERFQWLPSDFVIEPNGKATLKGSYINNIHPTHHKDLYPVIEQLVGRAVPMWERVLSDLRRPLTKLRMFIEDTPGEYGDYRGHVACIYKSDNGCSLGPPSPHYEEYPDHDSWTDEQHDEFQANFPKTLPEALPSYTGALDDIQKSVDLAGSTLQVIVKLANIVLSPESSEYPGGAWHVEGMLNERIVSTFIYYYDEENITDSRLDFRTAVLEPKYHGQDDNACSAVLYNMTRDSPLVQGLGGVKTCQGRCIAFPNIYQHQVQPFSLVDKTKSGHRKIVALFLIDPYIRIPSTLDVAPQQREWIEETLLSPDCLGQRLPLELIHAIVDMTADATMTRSEAEAVREEVMKERSVMVQSHTDKTYGIEFNMCEH